MKERGFREILIFVAGTTPQIITETLYGLTQSCNPPIFPDEIYIITTASGREKIQEELLHKGRLLSLIHISEPTENIFILEVTDHKGIPLEDIRQQEQNEALGDFITEFIREKAQDKGARLHCSLAGGRKTMSFYLGTALQLFGRRWDKLYHVLVSPEFESHPEFFYKPRQDRILEVKDHQGKTIKKLHTQDAQISLAELPFIRLRDKLTLNGKGFKELVQEGQRDIDTASFPPRIRVDLRDRLIHIGNRVIEMVPVQLTLYQAFLREKVHRCRYPDRSLCLECTDCFPTIADLSSPRALEEMAEDYRRIYGHVSGRVEGFWQHWAKRGGIDQETLRQNISKINRTLREQLEDETLLPFYIITPVGKHGGKRYGVKLEKGKIRIGQ